MQCRSNTLSFLTGKAYLLCAIELERRTGSNDYRLLRFIMDKYFLCSLDFSSAKEAGRSALHTHTGQVPVCEPFVL